MFTSSFTDLNQKLSNEMIEFLMKQESSDTDNNLPKSQIHILNAKKYYLSCINEDFIEKFGEKNFLDFINEYFGGWRLINPIAPNSTKMDNFFQIYEVKSHLFSNNLCLFFK